jgi:hypothetical protein
MISIPQSRRSFLIPVTLIIGAVLLTRLPTLFLSVVDWDETAYALVARDWLHGMWPGVGSFDHKPVALDAVFALVIAAGGDTPVATRMISLLFVGGGRAAAPQAAAARARRHPGAAACARVCASELRLFRDVEQ